MTIEFPWRRALWAALLLATGAACTSSSAVRKQCPCPIHTNEHVVLLRAEQTKDGTWKAVAHPDVVTVRGYSPEKPDSILIWSYRYASTRIRFEDKAIPEPTCVDKIGECKLALPGDLALQRRYKYTVTGSLDEKTNLVPNDPWIEVDR